MYRILGEKHEVRERRNQRRNLVYAKPRLLATAPNQVWTWDITRLPGPAKWVGFCLYVLLDLFSRFAARPAVARRANDRVVGWLVAERESAALAEQLIGESAARHRKVLRYLQQGITPSQLCQQHVQTEADPFRRPGQASDTCTCRAGASVSQVQT